MQKARVMLAFAAGAMLCGGVARAQMEPAEGQEPHPGAAALAAAGNVVFMPVRLALTAIGGELGGLTGWLTAGNTTAAQDIWHLPPFDGQTYLEPEMLYGQEPLMIGDLEYRMHVTPP